MTDRLLQLMVRGADSAPGIFSVQSPSRRLSGRDVVERSAAIASHLHAKGVGPGSVVGIALPTIPELIPAVIGVLQCGAAFVLIEPTQSPDRMAHLVATTTPSCIVTDGPPTDELAHLPSITVGGTVSNTGAVPPTPHVADHDLAYVMFTSGSTGKPKGVEVSRGALASFLEAIKPVMALRPGDVVLSVTNVHFDPILMDLLVPFICGTPIVLPEPHERADAVSIMEIIERFQVTVAFATPLWWRELMTAAPKAAIRCITGGDAVPPDLANQLVEAFDEVWNVYGPTEATIWATAHRVTRGADQVPIGAPLANTVVQITGERGEPVGVGEIGEIWLGGNGLAIGYRGQADLTNGRFVTSGGHRWYRTGDQGFVDADGVVHYRGRIDRQVKIRGVRIELAEVESVLAQHPGVLESCVVARGGSLDRTLAGFFRSNGRPVELSELAAWMRSRVPAEMVPTSFTVVDAWPQTANGKIDRTALPEGAPEQLPRDLRAEPSADAAAADTGKLADDLADIWAAVLKVEHVEPTDNFFALGGHSLLATRVIARARKLTGRKLPVALLFDNAEFAAFAAAVERRVDGADATLGRADRSVPLSLSLHQAEWLPSIDAVAARPFTVRVAPVEVRGAVTTGALERALRALVARHEILRLRYSVGDEGQVVQSAGSDAHAPTVEDLDLTHLPEAARLATFRQHVLMNVGRGFALNDEAPLRATLLRNAPDHAILLLCVHEACADGQSVAILVEDLALLLAGMPLPRLDADYLDLVPWAATLPDPVPFWTDLLAPAVGAERLFPEADHDDASELPRLKSEQYVLGAAAHGSLASAGEQFASTRQALTTAALAAVIHDAHPRGQIRVGAVSENRRLQEAERIVGPLASTFVVSLDFRDPELTLRQLVQQARHATLTSDEHATVPFSQAALPTMTAGADPAALFEFVVMSEEPRVAVSAGSISLQILTETQDDTECWAIATGCPLAVSARATETHTLLVAEFDPRVLPRELVASLLRATEQVLEAIAANPDTPVASAVTATVASS